MYALPGVFAFVAFLLGFGGTSCSFLQFSSTSDAAVTDANPTGEPLTIHFGFWYYQSWQISNSTNSIIEESCDHYPDSINIDKNWKAARIFSVITLTIGASLLLLNVIVGCLSSKKNFYTPTGWGYLLCCVTQGFGLLLLDSNVCKNNALIQELEQSFPHIQFDDTCSMSRGAKCTIAATVLWFVAGVIFVKVHPSGGKDRKNNAGATLDLDSPLYDELIPENSEDDVLHGVARSEII